MATSPFQALSVGSLVQKLLARHPELGVDALIAIVKQSVERTGKPLDGFSGSEVLNETRAMEMARAATSQASQESSL